MTGKIRIMTLLALSITGLLVYAYLFSTILGVSAADAVSLLTTGSVRGSGDAVPPTAADSMEILIAQLESAKDELDSLRGQIEMLRERAYLDELAEIVAGLQDSTLIEMLSKMEKGKIKVILKTMPAERAAVISAKLPREG